MVSLTTKADRIRVQIAIQEVRLLSLGSSLDVSFCKVPFHIVTQSVLALCFFSSDPQQQPSRGCAGCALGGFL